MDNDNFQVELTGEDAITKETPQAERYANYEAYKELLKLGYEKYEICEHMSCTEEELDSIVDEFSPGTE